MKKYEQVNLKEELLNEKIEVQRLRKVVADYIAKERAS